MLYATSEKFTLYQGDNRVVLKELADNSVDSIVTDPPYELGFMGKKWDASGIAFNVEVWQECLRVLKPGGHVLAFSGSRTYHRMAVAIEDAGFEIRDQIMWIYGSGFPKSLDVSKAIDKRGGYGSFLVKQIGEALRVARESRQISKSKADEMFCDGTTNWTWFEGRPAGQRPPTPETFNRIVKQWPELQSLAEMVAEAEREVVGSKTSGIGTAFGDGEWASGQAQEVDITAPATAEAKRWQGWGTALKPAHEPIVVARKPLIGTVAENVLTYGTGGLNIDGGRVISDDWDAEKVLAKYTGNNDGNDSVTENFGVKEMKSTNTDSTLIGRWPANVIHDGSDEVVELFPNSKSTPGKKRSNNTNNRVYSGGWDAQPDKVIGFDDSGSAARFFYCAKASKRDRNEGLDGFEAKRASSYGYDIGLGNAGEGMFKDRNPIKQNHHPTVKPTTLMEYLCKLVTPPNGIVLDPFMGSGSTGKAAMYAGFNFIGIEMTEEYLPIAKARIEFAVADESEKLL